MSLSDTLHQRTQTQVGIWFSEHPRNMLGLLFSYNLTQGHVFFGSNTITSGMADSDLIREKDHESFFRLVKPVKLPN